MSNQLTEIRNYTPLARRYFCSSVQLFLDTFTQLYRLVASQTHFIALINLKNAFIYLTIDRHNQQRQNVKGSMVTLL